MIRLSNKVYKHNLTQHRAQAMLATSAYPQYAHRFDTHVLVEVTRAVKMKGSDVTPGAYIADPVPTYYAYDNEMHLSVWNPQTTAHASIPMSAIEYVAVDHDLD